ncbi:MAG: hypothetical protein GY936_11890 [Ignavibacteriae bacterium]|nr:hypothetical protein [Ignavibacteriota bacterium]
MSKIKILAVNIILLMSSLIVFPQAKERNKTSTQSGQNSFTTAIQFLPAKYSDVKKSKFIIRDFYENTDVTKFGTFKLPTKHLIFAIPPNSKPIIKIISKNTKVHKGVIPTINPKVVSTNDSTLTLVEQEIDHSVLNKKLNKSNITIENYFWYRDLYCVSIAINTHNFNSSDNSISELEDIKLKFSFPNSYKSMSEHEKLVTVKNESNSLFANWEIADQFRNSEVVKTTNENTDSWINYNADYLKIAVVKDGIFRIDKNTFENVTGNGISVNPNTFQLYSYGNEEPIFVEGDEDGSFNDGDFIEFYGHKNYSKISNRIINSSTEEYNEFLNRYSDTTFYFLTWNIENGKRIDIQNIFNSSITDSLDYYSELLHVEENTQYQILNNNEIANQTPNWNKNKSSYWNWFGSWDPTKIFDFNLENVLSGKSAEIYVKLVSGASSISGDAHQLAIKVNSTKIDSQSINRFDQVLLGGVLSSNNLIEGSNLIEIELHNNNSTGTSGLVYDWYEIEYPKSLSLAEGFLNIKVPSDIVQGEKIVKVENANSQNYVIYRTSPDQKKITNYQVIDNILYFTDTMAIGSKYSIVEELETFSPSSIKKKNFLNLRNSQFQADYIAITHPKFISVSNNYLAYIEETFDVNAQLINVEDIYDEFGYGFPTPESIKEFVKSTFQYWSKPIPRYLTLIGDATYDYKGYIYDIIGVKISENYVPSFGFPVGDNWYGIFDDTQFPIPQIKIGRLPILEPKQLTHFLSKIQNNENLEFDDWNKRYLFFSGGDENSISEISSLKLVNDTIISRHIVPKPISGNYSQFYKTNNPVTDFGPYSAEEVQSSIDASGVFISYTGHSGTSSWDNSITSTTQLINNIGRNPLVSDFGCSTNKFAEPDIICFGEEAVLDDNGQAIGYIGNSSLGFFSTSLGVPQYFFGELFSDSTSEIGNAHLTSKLRMFNNFGNNGVTKIFSLTNSLVGDPIIQVKIPKKPNLIIDQNSLIVESSISEDKDSVKLEIIIKNLGTVPNQMVDVLFEQSYEGEILVTDTLVTVLPEYLDTLQYYLTTKNLSGNHKLKINIDPNNKIDEIYEDDNNQTFDFHVANLTLRDLTKYEIENGKIDEIKILNSVSKISEHFNIQLQIADNKDFINSLEVEISPDSFYTSYLFDDTLLNKRYWFRYKKNNLDTEFSSAKSFMNSENIPFLLSDSISFANQVLNNVSVINNKIKIDLSSLEADSSGYLLTNLIGPANAWESLSFSDEELNKSSISYDLYGIKNNGTVDTIFSNILESPFRLDELDAEIYPYLKVKSNLNLGESLSSPILDNLGVKYTGVPELGINYQVVSVDQDTLQQGEDVNLSFYVFNVGESVADSFKIHVDVIKTNNSKENIFDQPVDFIGSEERKLFTIPYNTSNCSGSVHFSISIDTDDNVLELYENNNFYSIPFYVIAETIEPSIDITFEGNDIFEGEYISATPKIKIELSEPSLIQITDTSAIEIYLNNKLIPYKNNSEILNISYSESNPKVIVNYTPILEDGEYELKVFTKNASGNLVDSSRAEKSFIVQSDTKILEVYNYPNPFASETYFTFKLTQIPDEVKIRIYTVAGRIIKELILDKSELNYDLNKIHWDGIDTDGDEIANGGYIYKVIMTINGETMVETKKLAVVR